MAALHASIDEPVTLIGGHDAIYEVRVGDELVYTNESVCGREIPEAADLAALVIERRRGSST